jgi:hypothetical protein
MIYLTLKTGQRLLIISQENVSGLKNGAPIITPDRAVMVMFTRDEDFLQRKVSEALIMGELDIDRIKHILDVCDARDTQLQKNEDARVREGKPN